LRLKALDEQLDSMSTNDPQHIPLALERHRVLGGFNRERGITPGRPPPPRLARSVFLPA
jgi:hypothetical protein